MTKNALPATISPVYPQGTDPETWKSTEVVEIPAGDLELGSGPVLHVATTGNDTTGNGSLSTPYLTINKAMSVATQGCTIYVHAGTYYESTASSVYVDAQTWFGHPVAVGMLVSGLSNNRCSLLAYPGDEGSVTLDGGTTQIGIHANDHDYWNVYGIRIKNCREEGIINNGQVPDHIPNLANLATGWRVENCLVDGVIGANGNNVSGIAPWGTKDWIIRNCFIKNISAEGSTVAAAIQTYGTINLLVEHLKTDGVEFGVFLKDHFISTDAPRTPYDGVEVRYCELKTLGSAINIGIRGTGSCEAGYQYIHHNVMYGFDGTNDEAIQFRMGGAAGQSTRFRFSHNVVDIEAGATIHLAGSAFNDIENEGNIYIGGSYVLATFYDDSEGKVSRVTLSDYNLATTWQTVMGLYGTSATFSNSLASWQARTIGSPIQVAVNNPDTNSAVVSVSGLFTNRAARDYTLAGGSTAIGYMADGSDAGAYQLGTEVIGLLSTYSAGV